MTMENNNELNIEDLKLELPDYISGELKDNTMRQKIEILIRTDNDFKNEYNSLRTALSFISTSEFEKPQELYFANLQSRILEKTSAKEEAIPFYNKIISYWKYLVPAVTVCIVILIYTSNMNTVPDKTLPVSKTEIKTESIVTPENTTAQKTEISKDDTSADNEDLADLYYSPDDEDLFISTTPVLKQKNNNQTQQQDNSNDAANIIKEDIKQLQINLFNSDEEDSYEDDYRSLSPEAQKQIIEELKKTSIH